MKFPSTTILLFLSLSSTTTTLSNAQQSYSGCDATEYYSRLGTDVGAWDRDGLIDLLRETHRRQDLPFTNANDPGVDDVWAALIDVDPGTQNGTVSLIYEDKDIASEPFGERTWVKEHLFPILRGVGILGPDVTDIHNIRPSSELANVVRGVKYFGECGVLVRPQTCQQPAEGAAPDTCSCNRVYSPPADVRGDIARALLYMDLRYDGLDDFTLDLRLTDCPFQPEKDMAYLSQMLTWHQEDPPTEEEVTRNNKVCANWQGNRNPFVDHPQLAQQLYGNPLPLPSIGESLIYEPCKAIPTLAPTYSPNTCDMYEPGDFQIWLMNSVDPNTVGVYSFPAMPDDFELFMTNNPWNGNEFLPSGGTLSFATPEGGLEGGAVFGYGADDMPFYDVWELVQGSEFDLSEDGQMIFLYCINAAGDQRPLLAFNYGGEWVEPGLDSYPVGQSALPEELGLTAVIDLDPFKNYFFDGESDLPDEELKLSVTQQDNWKGSNTQRFGVSDVTSGAGTTSTTTWTVVAMMTTTIVVVTSSLLLEIYA